MTIKTSVVRQLAGMHLQATTGSGFAIAFDSGRGQQAAGPTEVLLSALAACTAMDVVSILAKKRQRYDRYEVQVRAEQRDDYPQVFTRIELTHEIEGANLAVAAVRRSIELSATKYCPISAMLSAGDTEIHHCYRVIGRSEPAFEDSGEVIVTGPARWPEVLRAAGSQPEP